MIKLTRPACPNLAALKAGNYKHANNKDALRLASFDKCMYCESKISHIDHAHVEHIKPKAENKFPELEFEWSNLGYACAVCNINKGDKYAEDCPYIDPFNDEPEIHLFPFGAFLRIRNGSERGEKTIVDIKLNRVELLEARRRRIEYMDKALVACHRTTNPELKQQALDELASFADSSEEYSVWIAALLAQHSA